MTSNARLAEQRTDFKLEKITVSRVWQSHVHKPGLPCPEIGHGCGGFKMTYTIDLQTWECTVTTNLEIALVSPEWLQAHCEEVSKRVRKQLKMDKPEDPNEWLVIV